MDRVQQARPLPVSESPELVTVLGRSATSRRQVLSRPLSVRLALGLSSALLGIMAAVVVGTAFASLLALVATLIVTAIVSARSFTVALSADPHEVVVRNQFRTYRLRWEDITAIGIGITSSIGIQVSCVRFRARDNRDVAAQATTKGERECRRVLNALKLMRPDLPIRFSE